MNKCENCGYLHYRTDPCRAAKKSQSQPGEPLRRIKSGAVAETENQSTAALKEVQRQKAQRAKPEVGTPDCTELASGPQASVRESAAGTQALPVETKTERGTNCPEKQQQVHAASSVRVRSAIKFDKVAYQRLYMRTYRAKKKEAGK